MAEDEKKMNQIDAGKATTIARNYLEENYGNIGMLLFRVISVEPNGTEDQFHVLCSLLNSIGSSKRSYYQIKVNIADGGIKKVFEGEESKDDPNTIILKKKTIQ